MVFRHSNGQWRGVIVLPNNYQIISGPRWREVYDIVNAAVRSTDE